MINKRALIHRHLSILPTHLRIELIIKKAPLTTLEPVPRPLTSVRILVHQV